MGFYGIFDIINISYLDINFLFKYFLLYNHLLCFFSLLTSLRLSMTKSKISLGKCHIVLEYVGYSQISFDIDF